MKFYLNLWPCPFKIDNLKFAPKLSNVIPLEVCHNHDLQSSDGTTRGEQYLCDIILGKLNIIFLLR
jgi:hypothetical protein